MSNEEVKEQTETNIKEETNDPSPVEGQIHWDKKNLKYKFGEDNEVKLDLNKLAHREIAGYFLELSGIDHLLTTLAKSYAAGDRDAWNKVHQVFPELKGKNLSFNFLNNTIRIND